MIIMSAWAGTGASLNSILSLFCLIDMTLSRMSHMYTIQIDRFPPLFHVSLLSACIFIDYDDHNLCGGICLRCYPTPDIICRKKNTAYDTSGRRTRRRYRNTISQNFRNRGFSCSGGRHRGTAIRITCDARIVESRGLAKVVS